jgi:hypothetical protein
MATDSERDLFAHAVLKAVGQQAARLGDAEVTGFLAMAGQAYDRGLMVVGRAVNGWTKGITPGQLAAPGEAERYARDVQESVSGKGKCPMLWVTGDWGAAEGYNTKRSAFWRCIRSVVQNLGIADVDDAGWPSRLVWSNLYKVSPAHGGNPSNALCEVQLPGCVKLFNLELDTYQPSRVLFLTGSDWAAPFLKEAELQEAEGRQYVSLVGETHGAWCVIAVHPQGKRGEAWTREVVAALSNR